MKWNKFNFPLDWIIVKFLPNNSEDMFFFMKQK